MKIERDHNEIAIVGDGYSIVISRDMDFREIKLKSNTRVKVAYTNDDEMSVTFIDGRHTWISCREGRITALFNFSEGE